MQIKVIFIGIIVHFDSLWNRGKRELGNGLLQSVTQENIYTLYLLFDTGSI